MRQSFYFGVASMLALASIYFAGSNAGWAVEAVAETDVPAKVVWDLIFHMNHWHDWNEVFSITIDGNPVPGKAISILAKWKDGTVNRADERIVIVDASSMQMCWNYEGIPDWMLSTDRCIIIEERTSDRSPLRIRNYEKFGGPLAFIVIWLKGDLIKAGFEAFNVALVSEADRRVRANDQGTREEL
mmetsp:Transcript_5235/g.6957  ORF Transcript_5235/g.6957 Transcript_5235/m.6957 type:complete len:186 (+) Transcript_5235:88-645(+)